MPSDVAHDVSVPFLTFYIIPCECVSATSASELYVF